jgi:DNA-binding MarR family transcriptional regulator
MKKLMKSSEFDDTLLPWIGRTMKLADTYITNQLIEHKIDLTKVQLILLKILYSHDGLPQNDLALLTNRDKASLARLLDIVERKGLVVRVPSKEDKRIKLVHITKKGIEYYERARPLLIDMISKIQHGISDRDIKFMIDRLRHMQLNLENSVLVA